jgi:regulator of protease activity HflC (stomatin/prohibitin superfamily)
MYLPGSIGLVAFLFLMLFLSGIRVVRPTGRGLVERLGKYRHMTMPGFNWIVPGIDRLFLEGHSSCATTRV